jgi:hypothetical protein
MPEYTPEQLERYRMTDELVEIRNVVKEILQNPMLNSVHPEQVAMALQDLGYRKVQK